MCSIWLTEYTACPAAAAVKPGSTDCIQASADSHLDLFDVKTFAKRPAVSGKLRQPPDRRESVPEPRSDDRWAVTLSGTSHWYSNLLHFLRERTPMWKLSTALGGYLLPSGFDPHNVEPIMDRPERQLLLTRGKTSTVCWSRCIWRVKKKTKPKETNEFSTFLLPAWNNKVNVYESHEWNGVSLVFINCETNRVG